MPTNREVEPFWLAVGLERRTSGGAIVNVMAEYRVGWTSYDYNLTTGGHGKRGRQSGYTRVFLGGRAV